MITPLVTWDQVTLVKVFTVNEENIEGIFLGGVIEGVLSNSQVENKFQKKLAQPDNCTYICNQIIADKEI